MDELFVCQIWPASCIYMAHELRMFFMFLNGWKKSKEKYSGIWKLYKIPTSVPINKVLLVHSHAHSFKYWLWLLMSCKGRAELRQRWTAKPKLFTLWLFKKEFAVPSHLTKATRVKWFQDWLIQYCDNVGTPGGSPTVFKVAIFLPQLWLP